MSESEAIQELRNEVNMLKSYLGILDPNVTWSGAAVCRNDWVVSKIIIAETARHFGLTAEEMLRPIRTDEIAWPRQIAMYLVREKTSLSLSAIARIFRKKDHATVWHASAVVKARMETNELDNKHVTTLINEIVSIL
jgi:chromosomal replication initiation ATPase DnaA